MRADAEPDSTEPRIAAEEVALLADAAATDIELRLERTRHAIPEFGLARQLRAAREAADGWMPGNPADRPARR